MEEVYKPTGVGSYEISNFGNCRRALLDGGYRVIHGCVINCGYRYFQLGRGGVRTNYLFHHLVASAFIGERPPGMVVDHIDRDKLNNNVTNLRYITQTDNIRNSVRFYDHVVEDDPIKRRNLLKKLRYSPEHIKATRKCRRVKKILPPNPVIQLPGRGAA